MLAVEVYSNTSNTQVFAKVIISQEREDGDRDGDAGVGVVNTPERVQ